MRPTSGAIFIFDVLMLLSITSGSVAHGNSKAMNMSSSEASSPHSEPETSFQYGDLNAWMVAHVFVMTISWVFILPTSTYFPLLIYIDRTCSSPNRYYAIYISLSLQSTSAICLPCLQCGWHRFIYCLQHQYSRPISK